MATECWWPIIHPTIWQYTGEFIDDFEHFLRKFSPKSLWGFYQTFTYSNSTMATLEKGVKYVQS